jgi:hypothetical protein
MRSFLNDDCRIPTNNPQNRPPKVLEDSRRSALPVAQSRSCQRIRPQLHTIILHYSEGGDEDVDQETAAVKLQSWKSPEVEAEAAVPLPVAAAVSGDASMMETVKWPRRRL